MYIHSAILFINFYFIRYGDTTVRSFILVNRVKFNVREKYWRNRAGKRTLTLGPKVLQQHDCLAFLNLLIS